MPSIAARRLAASRLIGTPLGSPAEAVGWHLAMQSQDYAPASWSIGQRSERLRSTDVDAALEAGSIVRTHVLRPTWHFVAAEDVRWLLALSGPRVQARIAPRYRDLGLDARTRSRAERAIARALEGGERLTRAELAEVLDRARIDRAGQRLPFLLTHCELESVIGSGGVRGRQQTFALLDERLPPAEAFDRDDATAELVRRYLRSHGPATVKDLAWWSGLTVSSLRATVHGLGSGVRREEVEGLELWSMPDTRTASVDRRVRLLQAYDEVVVGYRESRFLGDPERERARAAWGDRTLPNGTVLFGDVVAGHWARRTEPRAIGIEVVAFDPRPRGFAGALEEAAERHGAFFERPVTLDVRRAGTGRRR